MNLLRRLGHLDVVIPCHNEEEVITHTHGRLTGILRDLARKNLIASYSIIFVDNGSTDATLAFLLKLFRSDDHVVVVSLRNNFGFQGSLTAGLHHTSGDAVITIDADLQDPPEKIEEMVVKYREGYDLVLGVRANRSKDSWFKRTTSDLYYRVLAFLGVRVVPNHGDFRLVSRELVDIFNALPERNRFIRALMLQLESRYATVEYTRTPRLAGYSKFGIAQLLSLAIDGITSFSYLPLRIASVLGFVFSLLSFIGMGYVVYEKLVYNRVAGWASTVLSLLFFSGLQLFFLGIIGEYLGKLYTEVKQRPLFTVRSIYSHDKGAALHRARSDDPGDERQEIPALSMKGLSPSQE